MAPSPTPIKELPLSLLSGFYRSDLQLSTRKLAVPRINVTFARLQGQVGLRKQSQLRGPKRSW